MCKGQDAGALGLHDECCRGDDDQECPLTVEAEMVAEACEAVVDAATFLAEMVAEHDRQDRMTPPRFSESLLWAKYVDVQSAIGELTRAMIEYTEPDAGMEPLD